MPTKRPLVPQGRRLLPDLGLFFLELIRYWGWLYLQ